MISHGAAEYVPSAIYQEGQRLYQRANQPLLPRRREQVARFFEGLELVPPGLVLAPCRRPETPNDLWVDRPERSATRAGVGRKP